MPTPFPVSSLCLVHGCCLSMEALSYCSSTPPACLPDAMLLAMVIMDWCSEILTHVPKSCLGHGVSSGGGFKTADLL